MRVRALSPALLPLLPGAFVAAACVYMLFLEPWGHDLWFHLHRLQDLERQIADGRLHAHFAGNLFAGKGLPVWIYYSQWVYWPALALTLLGASPLIALKLVFAAFLAFSSLGCFRLLALHTEAHTAAFGTLLYVTANYVIGDIFVRSAYPEFLSYALLPWLLFALHGTLRGTGAAAGIAVVIVAALMVLFHPLSFMNSGVALIAYAVYVALEARGAQARVPYTRLLGAAALLVLALALTAFYWLPAVVETRYVLGTNGMPIRLEETFLYIARYLNVVSIESLGFVLTVAGAAVAASVLLGRRRSVAPDRQAAMPHAAGWTEVEHRRTAAAARPTVMAFWPLAAGIVVYAFLTLRVSEPVWSAVPFLAANNFVWRLLYPLSLLAVVFVTAGFSWLPRALRAGLAPVAFGGLAIAQGTVFIVWHTATELSLRRTPVAEIEAHLDAESERTDGWGIDEYRPDPSAVPTPPAGVCRTVRSVAPHGFNDSYETTFALARDDAGACVHVPRFWNVRYQAAIDGVPVVVYANADGEILLPPTAAEGRVTLSFGRPPYVTFAELLSALAAVASLLALLLVVRMRRRAR